MPLQICPDCKKFHYVPGACPEPRVVGGSIARNTVTPLPKPTTKKNTPEVSGTARKAPGGKPTARADIGALKQGPKDAPRLSRAKEPKAESAKAKGIADRGSSRASGAAGSAALILAESSAAHLAPMVTVRGTPRVRAPKGTFDRKAYQAEKARERRAKLKGATP